MANQEKNKSIFPATHLPVLITILQNTKGPVLELGAGYFSTPVIDFICRRQKRFFVSYENDREWCEKLWNKKISQSANVKMIEDELSQYFYVKDWDQASFVEPNRYRGKDERWSIAFIDHRPAIKRKDSAYKLKDTADFVVLHDSEPEINRFYRYTWIYDDFKYKYDYTKCKPNTVVLSNFVDLQKFFNRYSPF